MVNFQELAQDIIDGRDQHAAELTRQALDEGVSPADILDQGLIAGMTVVGVRFRDNIIFVPEVLISARAMKAAMAILEPVLTACGIPPVGKVVMGTVKGDIHDIGKNLVGMMLKGAGFQVFDLGVNVTLQKFQAAIDQHQPDLVGMSALLTTTMGQMKINIEAFDKAGLFEHLRVMVGGAPVSEDYARSAGAHGHGKDASAAVQLAMKLLGDLKASRTAVAS